MISPKSKSDNEDLYNLLVQDIYVRLFHFYMERFSFISDYFLTKNEHLDFQLQKALSVFYEILLRHQVGAMESILRAYRECFAKIGLMGLKDATVDPLALIDNYVVRIYDFKAIFQDKNILYVMLIIILLLSV